VRVGWGWCDYIRGRRGGRGEGVVGGRGEGVGKRRADWRGWVSDG
jgi:hypothetical protein